MTVDAFRRSLLKLAAVAAMMAAIGIFGPMSAAAQEIIGPQGPLRIGQIFAGPTDGVPHATVFRFIERSEFGVLWPLTADWAYVGCARQLPRVSVVAIVEGGTWALNAESKAWTQANHATIEVDGTRRAVQAGASPEPWIAEDIEFPGAQMNLAPLLILVKRLGCLPKFVPGTLPGQ